MSSGGPSRSSQQGVAAVPLNSRPPNQDVPSSSRPLKNWGRTKAAEKTKSPPFGAVSKLVQEDLDTAVEKFQIQCPFTCILPGRAEFPSDVRPYCFSFGLDHLEAGARIPFDSFTIHLLEYLHLAPIQLSPNSYRFINSFRAACFSLNIELSISVFFGLFYLKRSTQPGFAYLCTRKGFVAPDYPTAVKNWSEKWFWVEPLIIPTFAPFIYPQPESVIIPERTPEDEAHVSTLKVYYNSLPRSEGGGGPRRNARAPFGGDKGATRHDTSSSAHHGNFCHLMPCIFDLVLAVAEYSEDLFMSLWAAADQESAEQESAAQDVPLSSAVVIPPIENAEDDDIAEINPPPSSELRKKLKRKKRNVVLSDNDEDEEEQGESSRSGEMVIGGIVLNDDVRNKINQEGLEWAKKELDRAYHTMALVSGFMVEKSFSSTSLSETSTKLSHEVERLCKEKDDLDEQKKTFMVKYQKEKEVHVRDYNLLKKRLEDATTLHQDAIVDKDKEIETLKAQFQMEIETLKAQMAARPSEEEVVTKYKASDECNRHIFSWSKGAFTSAVRKCKEALLESGGDPSILDHVEMGRS